MNYKDFIKKYGYVEVMFRSYYKYTFTFQGVARDGCLIECHYGGNGDDIYRYEVTANTPETIGFVRPSRATITFPNGDQIEVEEEL